MMIFRFLSKIYFYRSQKTPLCVNFSSKWLGFLVATFSMVTILSVGIIIKTGSFFPSFSLTHEDDQPIVFYIQDLQHNIKEVYESLHQVIPQLHYDDYYRMIQQERYNLVHSFKHFIKNLSSTLLQIPVIFPFKSEWPVGSSFGLRFDPIAHKEAFHTGIDILAIENTPIYSTAQGVVIDTGYSQDYGYFIKISHSFGFSSLYAHMMRSSHLKEGDVVKENTLIGYVGSSGRSKGYHLHYEVLSYDYYLDPQDYLSLIR